MSDKDEKAQVVFLGQIIAARLLRDSHDDCEVVGFTGGGRCIEPAVAVRIDGEFVDLVCAEHARRTDMPVVYRPGSERGDAS